MNPYQKLLIYIVTFPLFLLSMVIPKKKNVWLFGSWKGTDYSDNSKYLFQHVNEHHKDINAVWLTRSDATQKIISDQGYCCHKMYSLRGIAITLRASAACISRAKAEDMPLYLSSFRTDIIQLWHGTPIKKLGQDLIENKALQHSIRYKWRNWIKAIVLPQTNYQYRMFIATSDEVGRNFVSAYNHLIMDEGIKVTGYPRNDIVLQHANNKSIDSTFRGIYLPTFRDNARESSDLFYQYGFSANQISHALAEHNISIDFKLHPEAHIGEQLKSEINEQSNLNFIDAKDIHSILGHYDFLISDYSSIFFDYLLLERPIIFAPFDYDEFIKDRGLYYDYNEITPGPRAKNWQDLISEVISAKTEPNKYQSERDTVSNRINRWRDAKNCERVVTEIKKLRGSELQ